MNDFLQKAGHFFLDILQTVVLALAIFVISYLFLFQPHQVVGTSMFPNFENAEFLLTDKITYKLREPKRGEVVIFKAPPSEPCAAEECEYIKRIVGLPGEVIKIDNGEILINGNKYEENYLKQNLRTEPGTFFSGNNTLTLNNTDYLLLGDNRSYSRDGREFGPINRKAIIGRALLRYWPPSKIGLVQ